MFQQVNRKCPLGTWFYNFQPLTPTLSAKSPFPEISVHIISHVFHHVTIFILLRTTCLSLIDVSCAVRSAISATVVLFVDIDINAIFSVSLMLNVSRITNQHVIEAWVKHECMLKANTLNTCCYAVIMITHSVLLTCNIHWFLVSPTSKICTQDSWAIARKTARCAQYMGALKSFESPHYAPGYFSRNL